MCYKEGGLIDRLDFLEQLQRKKPFLEIVKNNKGIEYYNIPSGFDIEVSSFYIFGEKRAAMYIWQFGICDMVTYGRTWEEFSQFIKVLRKVLGLSQNKILITYVHNLPYEFQFIRKRFKWDKVFFLDDRKPVYAQSDGIEFRCSLKLAGGKSLENVAKDLQSHKVEKKVGQLDYESVRSPETPLTQQELEYCEYDIRVILAYISEKIVQDGSIIAIPLTNTGYVRDHCRKSCFSRWRTYKKIMLELTIDPDEYSQLKRAFQGGFTHANANYVQKIIHNVESNDFTSSYPAVMVFEKFPMSKAKLITGSISEEDFINLLHTHCCMFDITFSYIIPKQTHEHPISKSKCWLLSNYVVDNGRVVCAEELGTTITEQDFFTYREFYSWDSMEIRNLRIYEKNYLPKNFVLSILDMYVSKTELKGITEEHINYMIWKNKINAAYGMVVTDIVRDEISYEDNQFITKKQELDKAISKYNSSVKRFLFYPWGVWVTAYARANLFSAILDFGDDYVYSDTDSIKSVNTDAHREYFTRYNEGVIDKIRKSAQYHNIGIDKFSPLTRDGIVKTIGLWDCDGVYENFKTLGAKRYLTFKHKKRTIVDGDLTVQLTEPIYEITLAGSNKSKTKTFLRKEGDAFRKFDDKLVIPPEFSGRLTLTYIDDETEGEITDYLGNKYWFHELSSVHMEKTEYSLSMSEEFKKYLLDIKDFGE